MFGSVKKADNDVKPMTYWEKQKAEKMAEQKKKINIFLSRRSSETGSSGYQTSRSAFAGGEVESRSRVSRVGSSSEGHVGGFASTGAGNGAGFAKGSLGGKGKLSPSGGGSMIKPPSRPMGF